jgi:predicted aldo/keto reductase-like oxidoreductase
LDAARGRDHSASLSDRKVVMKHISLGGLDVSRIGLGTMAMSGYYLDPTSSDAESIHTIQRAVELGVTHIDTAEIYGPYTNEELVGRALKGRRDGSCWRRSSASSHTQAVALECSTAARRTSGPRSRAP